MTYACIDIGSNTTRLLVAECPGRRLRELTTLRAFTRIGRSLDQDRRIPGEKLAEVSEVVAAQVRVAEELGAARTAVVATAAIREATNGAEFCRMIAAGCGHPVEILTPESEARLAFAGATGTLDAPVAGDIAVLDVGGGSTEIAVGTVAAGVSWFASYRIGSGFLTDRHLRSDPPAADELAALRAHVRETFAALFLDPPERAVAVGGSATSLRRVVGADLTHEALERALAAMASAPRDELARRFDLDPERARLLPAGVTILDEVGTRLGRPLVVGNGGLREGVVLALAEGRQPQ